MSTETWGMMPKSQIDDETIEQAIDRITEDHNNDPEAHLAEGQSLTSHRAAEIIDHRIGSVVSDKLSHQEEVFFCSFESLGAWSTSGNVSLDGWPGVNIVVEDGGSTNSSLSSTVVHSGNFQDYTKDMLVQESNWHDVDDQSDAVFGLGFFNAWGNYDGFGFEWVSGVLRGFWKGISTVLYTDEILLDVTSVHVYRAQYVAADQAVYFFVDGIDAGNIAIENPTNDIEPQIFHNLKLTGGDTDVWRARAVLLSRQP